MKKRIFWFSTVVLLVVSLMFNSVAFACGGGKDNGGPPEGKGPGGPVVSTQWLANNINKGNLVIIDIRSEEEYQAGHIEGSVNIPYIVPFQPGLQ